MKQNKVQKLLKDLEILMSEKLSIQESLECINTKESKKLERELKNGTHFINTTVISTLSYDSKYFLKIGLETNKFLEALKIINKNIEITTKNKKEIFNLLVYPIFLFLSITFMLNILVEFFLPRLKVLNDTNSFVNIEILANFLNIFLCLVIIIAFLSTFDYTKSITKKIINLVFFKIICINKSIKRYYTSYFLAKYLSILLTSGFSLKESFSVILSHENIKYLKIENHLHNIKEGQNFSKLIDSKIITTTFLKYYILSKNSISLGNMLNIYYIKITNEFYNFLSKVIKTIQPISILIVGVFLVYLYYIIIIPIYNNLNEI